METIDSNHTIISVATDITLLVPSQARACSRERSVTTFEEDAPAPYLKISLITT